MKYESHIACPYFCKHKIVFYCARIRFRILLNTFVCLSIKVLFNVATRFRKTEKVLQTYYVILVAVNT